VPVPAGVEAVGLAADEAAAVGESTEVLPVLVAEGSAAVVPASSSPPRVRSHPPTTSSATAATASRTQKPRSGSGVPVPGTV
jgi:uncharacterized protein (DUF1501 family)